MSASEQVYVIALGVGISNMCMYKKNIKRNSPQIIATDFFMKINNPASGENSSDSL